eukprot:3169922-Rhodomonas_salina.3
MEHRVEWERRERTWVQLADVHVEAAPRSACLSPAHGIANALRGTSGYTYPGAMVFPTLWYHVSSVLICTATYAMSVPGSA